VFDKYPRLIAFVAGALAATGFAPLNLWPMTLVGLALLLGLIRRAPHWRAAAARGWWWGWGHFIINCNWIAHAFTFQEAMPHWLGYGAVVGLAAFLGLYVSLVGATSWWVRARGLPFTLIFAASWVFSEYARSTLFSGYIWDPLGVVLINTILAAPARYIGTYGLSGLVASLAGLSLLRATSARLLFIVAILLVWLGGRLDAGFYINPRIRVSEPLLIVVQPNIPESDRHDPKTDFANLIKLMRSSGSVEPNHPRLILWPEGALSDYPEEDQYARERLATLLGPKDVLVAGGEALIFDRKILPGGGIQRKLIAAHNSTFVLNSTAQLIGRYDKAHLVPGGEYLPLRAFATALGLARLVPGDLDFVPGPGPRTLTVPGFGKMGNVICYEIIFSGEVVDRSNRPDFIFNPSSDAWFGAWGPPQHLAQAQMRALEEGIPIVRATPTGISAVISGEGRIMRSLPANTQGSIAFPIPQALPPTLFARYGNAIPLMLAAIFAIVGIALARRTS